MIRLLKETRESLLIGFFSLSTILILLLNKELFEELKSINATAPLICLQGGILWAVILDFIGKYNCIKNDQPYEEEFEEV